MSKAEAASGAKSPYVQVGLAFVCATLFAALLLAAGTRRSDVDYFWLAANALVHGRDPYQAVRNSGLGYPLFYPLPAIVVLAPLGWMPLAYARVAFAWVGTFLLAWAGFRQGRALYTALISASFLTALFQGQWSPLLPAGAVIPWLGALWIAKPSIGLALAAAYPSRRAAVGAVALLAVSVLLMPGWPGLWLDALRATNHVAPVLRPGGALLLLAFLRWRRPEGRLLGVLACVPQTIAVYETLPLFLIPNNRREGYLLAGLTFAGNELQKVVAPFEPGMPIEGNIAARWPVLLAVIYLPALLMVLRRPNLTQAEPAGAPAPTTARASDVAAHGSL